MRCSPFPEARYLAGLSHIEEQHLSTTETVLVVIGSNLIMLMLLELPLLGFVFAPDWTPGAVDRAKAFAGRNARKVGTIALAVLGGALIIKGTIELAS